MKLCESMLSFCEVSHCAVCKRQLPGLNTWLKISLTKQWPSNWAACWYHRQTPKCRWGAIQIEECLKPVQSAGVPERNHIHSREDCEIWSSQRCVWCDVNANVVPAEQDPLLEMWGERELEKEMWVSPSHAPVATPTLRIQWLPPEHQHCPVVFRGIVTSAFLSSNTHAQAFQTLQHCLSPFQM